MKPENKALIKSLLDQSESLEEDIFDDTEQMLGTVPFILRTMARRPESAAAFNRSLFGWEIRSGKDPSITVKAGLKAGCRSRSLTI